MQDMNLQPARSPGVKKYSRMSKISWLSLREFYFVASAQENTVKLHLQWEDLEPTATSFRT